MEEIDFDNLKSEAELQAETKVDTTVKEVPEEVNEDVEQIEETEEESVEDESTGDDTQKKDESPWGKSNVVPKGVKERFSKLSGKLRQTEEKLAQMENYFNKMQAEAQRNTPNRVPTKEDFIKAGKTEGDYINYLVQVNTQAQMVKIQEQQAQLAQQQKAASELSAKWETAMEKAKTDLPDYDDVVAESDVKLSINTMRYLATSELGPYITYTIAKRNDLQQEINSLPVAQRHDAVLKVESMVKQWLSKTQTPVVNKPVNQQQPQKVVQKLRTPKTLGTVSKTKLDPATASIEEWLGLN